MTPSDHVKALIKEIDAQRADLSKLARLPDDEIKTKFHDEATRPLKSLAARADNMEATQKGLFPR